MPEDVPLVRVDLIQRSRGAQRSGESHQVVTAEQRSRGLKEIQHLTAMALDAIYETAAAILQHRVGWVGSVVDKRDGIVGEFRGPRVAHRHLGTRGALQQVAIEREVVVALHHNAAGWVGWHAVAIHRGIAGNIRACLSNKGAHLIHVASILKLNVHRLAVWLADVELRRVHHNVADDGG